MRTKTRRQAVLGLSAAAALALSTFAGCSVNDAAEKAAENAGIDNLALGGSGTVKIGDETLEFEVATCLEDGGSINMAAQSQDPAVVVTDAAEGSIAITNGTSSYVASTAEVTVEDGKLTATGTADVTTVDGQPADPVQLEVTADCD